MSMRFLNVDLEIVTAREPVELLRELGDRVILLYSGGNPEGYLTCLDLSDFQETPHEIVERFAKLLAKLTPTARKEWDNAKAKRFDIGFETEAASTPVQYTLDAGSMKKIVECGASLAITVYPCQKLLKKRRT